MDFTTEDPYNRKHLRILVFATYEPTFYILHLYEALYQHQLTYNIKGQIICKILRKITYEMIVCLHFYV